MRALFIAAVLAVSPQSAAGQSQLALQSAEDLYAACLDYQRWVENPNDNWSLEMGGRAVLCVGAIAGMNTMLNDLSRKGWMTHKICSNHISPRQAVGMYVQFVRAHPWALGGFSSDAYHAAMIEHFLCERHPWE